MQSYSYSFIIHVREQSFTTVWGFPNFHFPHFYPLQLDPEAKNRKDPTKGQKHPSAKPHAKPTTNKDAIERVEYCRLTFPASL